MQFLTEEIWFPPVNEATSEGLLAIGGDLSVKRLKLAYQSGIFPWYGDAQPIMWWSPDPRMVLFPDSLYVSKNLRKKIQKEHFTVTFNKSFKEVIHHCANVKREDQGGTWITDEMLTAYTELHNHGMARSVEVWNGNKLVGGLYGIDLQAQRIFCGESMFSLESDASKVALYYLVQEIRKLKYQFIDCQMYTEHLARMGAREIPRSEFLKYLQ
ncbi:MAG: leucyl/phenylalanyl-tRNA--protein transferase [Bacteroidia bacterium]|nr:leucyl/phenylalanyl-tRNA--protein transferase [Bacteroidia bacterium]NNF30426.1 leucyl/phenylalanyl-tRNA--protein transferase [Flavobacteriaceae bacterium]MBT8275673.1 leucyl/phenylalanyl-tRNA--protein transferase [Bacteroidia bacterium]NNJ82653.1 leucyl/phenylalanyl-tRNA--protein transferase [Flavobacteriaceae bacterium]NNK54316.1 leucyl/phenylalanyl-tRNA--protein transferase [Flavobacteriaceae bacterium]